MSISKLSFLFPAALLALGLAAQTSAPEGEAYRVPGSDALVRIWSTGAATRAAVSHDAGRSWRQMADVDNRLMLRYGAFDPLAGEPPVAPSLRAVPGNRLFVVQFKTDVIDEYREALIRAGAQVHQHLPFQSYIVRVDPVRVPVLRALPFVRWVGAYQTAFKLEPAIGTALLAEAPMPTARYNIVLIDKRRDAAKLEADVVAVGGAVNVAAGGGLLVDATLTPKQLVEIARRDTVLWIDRSTPPEVDMDNARIQTGADYVESMAGVDGKGLTGHICEGVYATHPEFGARAPYRTAPIGVGSSSGTGHGTNTAGEVYAQGLRAQAKGMVPFAQMTYTNYSYVYNNSARYALTTQLISQYNVSFQTASWGYARTLSYDSRSAEMDDIILDHDLFVTQSQSNAGATSDPRMSRPQAWAKNITSVGGFRHYNNSSPSDDCWCNSGSTGPAADGRIGVSFAAYYDSIYTTSSTSSYTSGFGGTSGATPIVNGCGAETIQMFADGHFGYPAAPVWSQRNSFLPHFSTTKVLMAATSRQVAFSRSNRYQQGWGLPSQQDLYDLRNNILVLDEEDVLTTGGSRTYWVWVRPNTPSMRTAMTYADKEGTTSSTIHRINSLDLKVTTPNGTAYWGNNGLLAGEWSTPGGSANDRDTEECVFLQSPASGVYEVTVRATAVRADTHSQTPAVDADFALAVAGIGGGRDTSGMKLDLISTATGDFRVSLTNLPASFAGGYTLVSANTSRYLSLGNLLGIEADSLALSILSVPQSAGNVFAFTKGTASQYPNATFVFPAAVALALKGRTFDAVAITNDAGGVVNSVSNVDRVTIQ